VISNMIQKQLDEEADKGPKHEAWMTMMPEEKALSLTLDEVCSVSLNALSSSFDLSAYYLFASLSLC
jgi:hypothetical protein